MKQILLNIKCHFNLRTKKGDKSIIYMVIGINGKQYKLPTGLFVNPHQWNMKKEMCQISDKFSCLENLNNRVANEKIVALKFAFQKSFIYICNNTRYCVETFQIIKIMKQKIFDEVGIKTRTRNVPTVKSNWNLVKWLNGKVQSNDRIRESTKETYLGHIKCLEKYLDSKGVAITKASQIDNTFMCDYYNWLITQSKIGRANDNIEGLLGFLKKYAPSEGIMTKSDVLNLSYDKIKDESGHDEIALTDEEVQLLWNYQCKSENDTIIRDMFVLNCLCGQRISDTYNVIKSYHTDKGKTKFALRQQKTNAKVDCPIIFQIADEILQKYHGKEFKMPSRVILNKHIKRIAKEAGITGECMITEQYGTKIEDRYIPRWEAISSHCARRTMTTLLTLRGWSIEKIKLYTGHKSDRMVERYAKMSAELQDYFDELPEEKKLKMKTSNKTQTSTEPAANTSLDEAYIEMVYLERYKNLLYYIGVEPSEFLELKTADEAFRLFYKNESLLLDSGLNLQEQVKALYNAKDKSLKERREALKALVDEAAKGLR